MRTLKAFAGPLALLSGFGCSDSSVTTIDVVHPTLVAVSPEEFLGNVPCLDAPGAMRRYVATLWDVTGTSADTGEGGAGSEDDGAAGATFAEPFALPSSGPVPCIQDVGFAFVVTGHRYVASVAGYDRDDLVQLEPGVPIVVDPDTRERVEPRWTTRCGDEDPVRSFGSITRVVRGCTPLSDSRPGGTTAVEVRIDDLLGDRACGEEAGAISRFEVRGPDGVASAACGEAVRITPSAGASTLILPLLAFEAGGDAPSLGTVCTARVVQSIVTGASCAALASNGTLGVEPRAALAAIGSDCSAAFSELKAEVVGDEAATLKELDSASCARTLEFAELPLGSASVRFTLRTPAEEPRTVLCSAAIEPGQVVQATCSAAP